MCELSRKSGLKRIDPCMRNQIISISNILKREYEIKACCCGHLKYSKTVVIGLKNKGERCFELFSMIIIPRTKKFYKKDKQGYYYIPEVVEWAKKK